MNISVFLGLCFVTAVLAGDQKSYNGHTVFRLQATNEDQLKALIGLKDGTNVDFWKEPSTSAPTDVMVAPEDIKSFEQLVARLNIESNVMIQDVQSVIDEQARDYETEAAVDFKKYNTIEEIYAFLDKVAADNKEKVKVEDVGKSTEGRALKLLRIGNGPKKVLLDGGIHARDWISPAVVTFVINELVKPENAALLAAYEFHILPVQNPDGYAYSHTKERAWRKTRSPQGTCVGVDANRNYNFQYATGGSSSDPCKPDYHGKAAESEPEVKLVVAFIQKHKYHLVIQTHSYGQLFMLPWAYQEAVPENNAELVRAANVATAALKAASGEEYKIGNVFKLIGSKTSGSSTDYMHGVAKSKYTYAIELRDTGKHGILLPADQIIPNGKEVFAAIKALAIDIKDK